MVHKDGEVMSKSKGNTVAPDDDHRALRGGHAAPLHALRGRRPRTRWSGATRTSLGAQPVPATGSGGSWTGTRTRSPKRAARPDAGRPARRRRARCAARCTRRSSRSREDVEERIKLNTAVAALDGAGSTRSTALEARGDGRARRGAVLREALETLVLLLEPVRAARLRGDVDAARAAASASCDRPWPVADAEVAARSRAGARRAGRTARSAATSRCRARRGEEEDQAPERSRAEVPSTC